MKESKSSASILLLVLGAGLLVAGFLVTAPALKTVSGLCIGIGAGLLGMSSAAIWSERYYQRNPDLKRESDITARDERTLLINEKSKARAYEILMRVMIVIPFLLILAEAPLWATLTTILVYLSGFGVQMYYIGKYNKEM